MTTMTSVDERTALRETLRSVLTDLAPPGRIRELAESANGHDDRLWSQLTDLGLVGLVVPESAGGSGAGLAELAVVCEELGRTLAAGEFLPTAALAAVALSADGPTPELERLAAGTPATVAVHATGVTAVDGHDGRVRLRGQADFVAEGMRAQLVLVPTDRGLAVADTDAPGTTREPMTTLDLTRRQASITWDDAPARLLTDQTGLNRALDVGALMLAAEQVGLARHCLDAAVAYAGERVQFGRPIGSFQAVKHLCADLLVDIELAQSAVEYAVSLDADAADFPLAVATASTAAGEAAIRAATECIHIHGGIGFTWEHEAHLYFRRARADSVLLAPRGHHRDTIAEQIGL
jgi:alkylation response protein AidB-like acyl-CoA dehydrogenase